MEQFDSSGEDHRGSPLWAHRSRHRHLEYVQAPLDELKSAAKHFGGSVNDAMLVALTEAAITYHARRDYDIDGFNTSFVVSTRDDNLVGGNAFTPVPIRVSGAKKSLRARFAEINQTTELAKQRATKGGDMGSLSRVINLAPTSVVTRAARSQSAKIDFATSNLRGAPFELYCAGAKVLASIPLGPLAGTPANITALSYNGAIDFGVFVDPVAIEDPAEFAELIDKAFKDIVRSAKPKKRKAKAKAKKKPASKAKKK